MDKVTVSFTGKAWSGFGKPSGGAAEATVGFEVDVEEGHTPYAVAQAYLADAHKLVHEEVAKKRAKPPDEPAPEPQPEPEPAPKPKPAPEPPPPPSEPAAPTPNAKPTSGTGLAQGHWVPKCPVHGRDMVARESQYEDDFWWTCPDRECKENFKEGTPGAQLCPDCGAPTRLRKSEYGEFYGCTKYNAKTKQGCSWTVDCQPATELQAESNPATDDLDDASIPF